MSYVRPEEVVGSMVEAGANKAALSGRDLLIRSLLSGGILGMATTLSVTATLQTIPLVGAVVFPVGFALIALLGLELVTGNFALLPLAWREGRASSEQVVRVWAWSFLGNALGALLYAILFVSVLTLFGATDGGAVAERVRAIAEAKTLGLFQHGWRGYAGLFCSAMLCNWLVCLAVVMAMTSRSTSGKIMACWLPIFAFNVLGLEHAVVNLFVIPCGMILGAKLTFADWLLNQTLVTVGNLVGGLVFTGLALYATYGRQGKDGRDQG